MLNLSRQREVNEFRKRYKWMALVVLLCFAVIIGRLVQLQLVERNRYKAIAIGNMTKTLVYPATRGLLRDAQGAVIASNRPSYDVLVTPQLLKEGHVAQLERLLALDEEEAKHFKQRLKKVPLWRRTHQIKMFHDISRNQLAALETHSAELPAVDVVVTPMRSYAFRGLAAHAVGYVNEVNQKDLSRANYPYRAGDFIGRTGLEQAYEDQLRGINGFHKVVVDARGRVHDEALLRAGASKGMRRDPRPGNNLDLTLDMQLMRAIERSFQGHPSGAAVVVEVNTGRVRALFSKPAYDLNEISGRLTSKRFAELTNDPFRPLIDKTLYETYFPGSTFKPISALAALGDHTMDASSHVECNGFYELGNRRFRCTRVHGEMDMRGALTQSCNVYFYRLAEQVGLDRLAFYARDFGFGERSGIGINGEATGLVPTRKWYSEHYKTKFRLGFTLNASIGQGNTRVTLLQLAMAYAAIANGGTLYQPQLVERISSPRGKPLYQFKPHVRRRVSSDLAELDYVMEGLRGVVNEEKGTAYDAMIKGGVEVAGKTGTAQVARQARRGQGSARDWYIRRDHAWFAGFAPVEQPRVAAIVLVEHGGAGGKTAAPIAIQILHSYVSSLPSLAQE